MNASFFSNLYPRFAKKDIYKCPFFKKGLQELKFSYIITLWASALPFCAGYLYDLILYICSGHVATIMVRIYNRDFFRYFYVFYTRYSKHVPKSRHHVYEKLLSQIRDIFLVGNYAAPFRRI
jgi:hypothetical protein